MDVGTDGNLFHQTVPDGLVAKFPFPVVRGRKPVLRYIPLHDNVIGLFQNQLVTLLHPAQLLLGALGSGHIHKHMKQGGIPLFVHREMCPVQKPDRVPVLSPGAVFHFHHISHPQLFPNLPQHLLPVPGIDQIPVTAVKLFSYLLLAITQKPAETVIHLPDRHMRVAQAQEGASQQIAPGPGCRLRFGLIPAFLSFSLYFPDEQNLFVVQGTGVHPQHGAAAPQNALRPPLPYPKMNLAAHLFPLQETAHRLRHKRNKRRPVLGKHGLLRKEADRILKPPAGPQRIKDRVGQIFQMIEAGLKIHLHHRGVGAAKQRQVFRLKELSRVPAVLPVILQRFRLHKLALGQLPVRIAPRQIAERIPDIFKALQKAGRKRSALPI